MFQVSIIINKPVSIVSKALMNPDNFPYWQTDLEKFEVIKKAPGEVGSIARLHYLQKGRSYIMEDELIYCEPKRKYVSQVTGEALSAQVETTLRPIDNKTEMNLKWLGKGKVFILKLLLPFLRRRMIKQSKEELKIFKKLVETRGTDFNKDQK